MLHKHLENITSDEWKKLFNLIPLIQSSEYFGEWKGLEKDPRGNIQLPYMVRSRVVQGMGYSKKKTFLSKEKKV